MPKVSDAHREARREEIIAAAIRAFTRNGLSRTSMADIITESGLSTGAIYGHFESKREILAAVAQQVLGRRRDEMDATVQHGPPTPGEAVEMLIRGMLRDGIEPRALIQLWAEATIDPELLAITRDAIRIVRGAFERALGAWLAAHPEHAPDGVEAAVRRLLPVVVSMAQGFVLQRTLFESFDEEEYLASVRTLLPH